MNPTILFPSRGSYTPSELDLYEVESCMRNLNPNSRDDNRDVIRTILRLRDVDGGLLYDWMVDPYDSGYYKSHLCDGISSPVPIWRSLGASQWGLKHHPAGAAHDCGYYRGYLTKHLNDQLFQESLELFAVDRHIRFLFRVGLSVKIPFIYDAYDAWNDHRDKQVNVEGYGSDLYIEKMKDAA